MTPIKLHDRLLNRLAPVPEPGHDGVPRTCFLRDAQWRSLGSTRVARVLAGVDGDHAFHPCLHQRHLVREPPTQPLRSHQHGPVAVGGRMQLDAGGLPAGPRLRIPPKRS